MQTERYTRKNNNTTIVRNLNPSRETQEVIIPQKRDNESLNTDSEMGTYSTTQNKFTQETESFPLWISFPRKTNPINEYWKQTIQFRFRQKRSWKN